MILHIWRYLLRTRLNSPRTQFLFGEFVLDSNAGLFQDERLVHIPPKELALLELLVKLQGQVASHADIERQLWPRQVVSYATLAHCVYGLRRSLGTESKKYIETVPKRGYRLAVPVRKIESPQGESAIAQSISRIPLALSHFLAGAREANDPRPAAQARSILLFSEAAKADPEFAAAHAAVADTSMYQLIRGFILPQEGRELGLQACTRALDINPRLVQGLAAMGWFKGVMMKQFDAAHSSLDTALSIDPDYARGHMYRSWVYRCQAQPEASIEAAKKAVDIDPHSLLNRHSYCWALFCGGATEDALQVERVQQRDYPSDDIAQGYVAVFAAYHLQADEALAACEIALELSTDVPAVSAAMAYVMARLGKVREARKLAKAAESAAVPRAPRPMIAPAYLELGEEQKALELLQEAHAEGCAWLQPAKLDPRLSRLASNPGFAALFSR